MLTIIHGDNTILSRKQLQTELDRLRQRGHAIKSFTANELTVPLLTNALQPTSLFGEEQVLVIERLCKMRSKTLRDQIITMLAAQSDAGTTMILWEDSLASAANLKLLQPAKPTISVYKTSPVIFEAMDLLGNPAQHKRLLQLLHQAYLQDTPEFVFSMLARQVRLLINVIEGEVGTIKPYPLQKLRRQVQFFTLEKLLKLHQRLLEIDLSQKLSATPLTLEQQLDLLAVGL